ncbi:MAG: polymorphic toxin type 30 domain-containing protein, partial [Actinomycetes bacterium]
MLDAENPATDTTPETAPETIPPAKKTAKKAAAKKAAKHEAAKEAERKAIAQQLKRAHNPLDVVPKGAERPPFHEVKGGSEYGANYKWTTKNGQTVRVRVHGPDASAPAGTNAANGVTYRVQVGQ